MLPIPPKPSIWKINASDDVQLKTARDIDFAKYKAIAMVCDNGATLPSTPATEQWFLHTPTGRNVLMMYDGSNWIPIISLGAMTLYVSATGTDDLAHGTAAGTDAFLTIQYAVNAIPGLVGGNVVINVGSGTFAENITIQGKSYTGNYSITFYGTFSTTLNTTTATGGTKGSNTAGGTITTGESWTASAYAGLMVQFNSDTTTAALRDQIRVIEDNTTSGITIVGNFSTAPVNTDTFKILSGGTIISGSGSSYTSITGLQQNINFYYFNFTGSNTTSTVILRFSQSGFGVLWYCFFSKQIYTIQTAGISFAYCSIDTSAVSIDSTYSDTLAKTGYVSTRIISKNTYSAVYARLNSIIVCRNVFISGASVGISAYTNSVIDMAGNPYNFIENCTTGLLSVSGSQIYGTANNQYASNGTNENATAVSYGYID